MLAQIVMQLDLFMPVHIADTIKEATLFKSGDFQWTVDGTQLFGVIIAINGAMVATLTVMVTKWMTRMDPGTLNKGFHSNTLPTKVKNISTARAEVAVSNTLKMSRMVV